MKGALMMLTWVLAGTVSFSKTLMGSSTPSFHSLIINRFGRTLISDDYRIAGVPAADAIVHFPYKYICANIRLRACALGSSGFGDDHSWGKAGSATPAAVSWGISIELGDGFGITVGLSIPAKGQDRK